MRQLTDGSGEITYAKSYDPYGVVTSTGGTSGSAYGFTGEQQDAGGMVYLRARYYNLGSGRFISRDTWVGNPRAPLSFNAWIYANANPEYWLDPSGHISIRESEEANRITENLRRKYGVYIQKDWGYNLIPGLTAPIDENLYNCEWYPGKWKHVHELELTQRALEITATMLGGDSKFRSAMKNVPINITRYAAPPQIGTWKENWAALTTPLGTILFYDGLFASGDNFAFQSIPHELGHEWDLRTNWRLSKEMSITLGTDSCQDWLSFVVCKFDIKAGKEPPPGNIDKPYAGTDEREDWAEAFANFVNPVYTTAHLCTNDGQDDCSLALGSLRRKYVEDQIKTIQ